ncbi:hypothetical protein EV356DRAFT_133209 [Viridothelium virens]|uniref:AAA+ ATPase domain-containing protein n=1 Tax=Viridothelium virens TaxID=1048519 RepID=A0A6A6HB01_VIRVR|nr:hypothetical protein EV356DRAFT_133209 [Viridothelium virens]
MADGLSLVASVAGLIGLADAVVRRLYKYADGVRGAREEVNRLIVETSTFYGLLQSFKLVAEELAHEPGFQPIRLPYLHASHKVLEKIKAELDKYATPASRWKWPLSSADTKELVQAVERQKTTLSVALAANNTKAILAAIGGLGTVQGRIHAVQDGVSKILGHLKHQFEAETRIVIDKDREKILNHFSQIVPRANYETNLRLRHPGMGIWLTESEEFQTWVTSPNTGLWLYGQPGVGKSILAASAIEYAITQAATESSENAVVYFFCDYKTLDSQVPANVLASLLRQLVLQNESSFQVIEKHFRDSTSRGRQWFLPGVHELEDLFVQASRFFASCLVIVDGADECGDNQSLVVQMLRQLRESSSVVKVLLLSRDELEIRQRVIDFGKMSIAARSSDIRLYVAAELEQRIANKKLRLRDASLKEVIAQKLMHGAQGMFRWVACQMDFLCELPTDASRRTALQSLPPTLFETYERILERINRKNIYSQRIVQKALRWTFAWPGIDPLPTKALCEAISFDDDTKRIDPGSVPDEEEILCLCSSLLRQNPSNDFIESTHFTVQVRTFQNTHTPVYHHDCLRFE